MYRIVFSFVFIVFGAAYCSVSFAQDSLNSTRVKTRENKIETKIGNLERLRQLSINATNEKKLEAIYDLLDEAILEQNKLYKSIAYQHLSTYLASAGQEDSVISYLYKALESFNSITEPIQDEELYNRVGVLINEQLIRILLFQNKKEEALYIVKENLKKYETRNTPTLDQSAYYNMGQILWDMRRDKEALEAFEKSLYIIQKLPEHSREGRIIQIYIHLSLLYNDLETYDKAIHYCDSTAILVDKEVKQGIVTSNYIPLNNMLYAEAYLGKNELKAAREYLDISHEQILKYTSKTIEFSYYQLESKYALKKNDYPLALQYIQKALEIYDPQKSENIFLVEESLLLYADILKKLKKSEEAYDILRHLYTNNDSINRTNYTTQVAELESIYQVAKLKDEAQIHELKLYRFKILLVFSILLTLSLLGIFLVLWHYKKRKHANQLLLAQKEKEIEKKDIELQEVKQLVVELKNAENFDQEVINKLDIYMSESKAYKQPNISRKEIAIEVGTNRQYLIDAIKSIKGQTFNEYIYSLRIEYAFELLTSTSMSIAEVQAESGFVSQPVFNTAFKKTYNLTPSELRKKVMQGEV